MKNIALVMFMGVIASCGVDQSTDTVQPATESTTQGLCKLDPTTGQCAVAISPDVEANTQPMTRGQLAASYPTTTPLDGGCMGGGWPDGGLQVCHVHFIGLFGYSMFMCNFDWTRNDDGTWSLNWFDCSIS